MSFYAIFGIPLAFIAVISGLIYNIAIGSSLLYTSVTIVILFFVGWFSGCAIGHVLTIRSFRRKRKEGVSAGTR